ncbi:hypothetical protein B296_00025751 [Ensete ventricosum]|uniref:Uncharacterized protein n=1 Tax=Ensete ventricosum TaxID=4639 RepID=A0A426Z1F4_ENSVE|nr:hypothetical protein B296_00025751 [Ensete ventricosum]
MVNSNGQETLVARVAHVARTLGCMEGCCHGQELAALGLVAFGQADSSKLSKAASSIWLCCRLAITVAPYRWCFRPHLSPIVHAAAVAISVAFLYCSDLLLPSLPATTTDSPLLSAPKTIAIYPNVASSLSLPSPFFPARYLHGVASLYHSNLSLLSLSQHHYFPCFLLPYSSSANR